MKKLYFLILLFTTASVCGQKTGLTETYQLHKLGYNPSVAGANNQLRITTIGQYGPNNELGSLKNYIVAAELPIFKSAGLAIQYSDYSYNLTKNKTIALNIAKHIKLSEKSSFSYGFTTGLVDTQFDFDSILLNSNLFVLWTDSTGYFC